MYAIKLRIVSECNSTRLGLLYSIWNINFEFSSHVVNFKFSCHVVNFEFSCPVVNFVFTANRLIKNLQHDTVQNVWNMLEQNNPTRMLHA